MLKRILIGLVVGFVSVSCSEEGSAPKTIQLSAAQLAEDGLVAHFEAAKITGVVDGQAVHLWNDSSGNDSTAVQSTASKRPIYRSAVNGVNNLPVLSFSKTASQEMFASINGMDQFSQLTVFAVVRTSDGGAMSVLGGQDFSMYLNIPIGSSSEGKVLAVFDGSFANNVEGNLSQLSVNDGQAHLVSIASEVGPVGNKSRVFIDGSPESIYGETLSLPGEDIAIGNQYGSSSHFFNGDIAEIAIYDKGLGDSTRKDVECYFAERFNLTLAYSCD